MLPIDLRPEFPFTIQSDFGEYIPYVIDVFDDLFPLVEDSNNIQND